MGGVGGGALAMWLLGSQVLCLAAHHKRFVTHASQTVRHIIGQGCMWWCKLLCSFSLALTPSAAATAVIPCVM